MKKEKGTGALCGKRPLGCPGHFPCIWITEVTWPTYGISKKKKLVHSDGSTYNTFSVSLGISIYSSVFDLVLFLYF